MLKTHVWNDLSMREKRELMRLYIGSGETNLSRMKEHYNKFQGGGDIKFGQPLTHAADNTRVASAVRPLPNEYKYTPQSQYSNIPVSPNAPNIPYKEPPVIRADNRSSWQREEDRKNTERVLSQQKFNKMLLNNQHLWRIDPTRPVATEENLEAELNYQNTIAKPIQMGLESVAGEYVMGEALKAAQMLKKPLIDFGYHYPRSVIPGFWAENKPATLSIRHKGEDFARRLIQEDASVFRKGLRRTRGFNAADFSLSDWSGRLGYPVTDYSSISPALVETSRGYEIIRNKPALNKFIENTSSTKLSNQMGNWSDYHEVSHLFDKLTKGKYLETYHPEYLYRTPHYSKGTSEWFIKQADEMKADAVANYLYPKFGKSYLKTNSIKNLDRRLGTILKYDIKPSKNLQKIDGEGIKYFIP